MNSFEGLCLFCENCNELSHMVMSFFAIFGALIFGIFIILVCIAIAQFAIHTSECNQLSHDNYRRILDLTARLRVLESERESYTKGVVVREKK